MIDHAKTGFSRFARTRARRSVVQAYYQWLLNQQSISDVIKEFEEERIELKKADNDYFQTLLRGMIKQGEEIDTILAPILDRPVSELDPIEKSILHLGIYELLYQPEFPWRAVINESVELARMFGAEESHKYINGVMDKLAHSIRATEIAASG